MRSLRPRSKPLHCGPRSRRYFRRTMHIDAMMGIDLACPRRYGGFGVRSAAVCFSGRKDLIEAALLNSNPREGAICRP